MTKAEKEMGYFKAHTTEVKIDGVPHRVATLYLDNLKKSLGEKVTVDKKEQEAADEYLKKAKNQDESKKVTPEDKKKTTKKGQ